MSVWVLPSTTVNAFLSNVTLNTKEDLLRVQAPQLIKQYKFDLLGSYINAFSKE